MRVVARGLADAVAKAVALIVWLALAERQRVVVRNAEAKSSGGQTLLLGKMQKRAKSMEDEKN